MKTLVLSKKAGSPYTYRVIDEVGEIVAPRLGGWDIATTIDKAQAIFGVLDFVSIPLAGLENINFNSFVGGVA